jgi:hypothetical protein
MVMTPTLWLSAVLLLHLDVATPFNVCTPRPHGARRSHVSMSFNNDNSNRDDWDHELMAELRSRISSNAGAAQLGPPEEVLRGLQAVFVLIFNLGKSDEGVYTLQGRTSPASSYVLAFEQTDEAQRFAQLLQAEGFDLPQPMEWKNDQVRRFCDAGRFELGVVPTGALLTPPSHNEYDDEAYGRLKEEQASNAELMQQKKLLERLFYEDGPSGPPGGPDGPSGPNGPPLGGPFPSPGFGFPGF